MVGAPHSKSRLNRLFQKLEPVLQHDGFSHTFILLYLILNVVIFFLTASPAYRNPLPIDDTTTLQLARAVARGGGATLNLNTALVILVASRSLMTYLRRTPLNMIVPFDKAMPAFHSLVGNMLTLGTLLHALAHAVRYSILRLHTSGFFGTDSLAISGSLLTIIMLAMKTTALLAIRRRSFETFYYVHSFGFVSFFILILIHGSHNGVAKSWMYLTAPLAIYAIDRMVRLWREKGSQCTVTKDSVILKGTEMVCLRIPRAFGYLPGQYCDIKVPAVSHLQWHPFTIASSPHESEMLFYIKVSGDWTRKLYTLFKEGADKEISIHVRGPYGAPAQHVGQYEHVVLISGGVGGTPFCSITKYAHHWILNYTKRGAEASNTVSAAFTRNQSVRGTPSVPGTPTRGGGLAAHGGAGVAVGIRSGRNSRGVSRNASSGNFAPNLRSISRSASKGGSRRMSRSGSRNMSSSGSLLERFNSGAHPLPQTGGRAMDRVTSTGTTDSVGMIVQEQRINQPYGPHPVRGGETGELGGVHRPGSVALTIPGAEVEGDDAAMERYLERAGMQGLPEDYDEALGNPELPIPDRRAHVSREVVLDMSQPEVYGGPAEEHEGQAQGRQTFELVQEYDSSQGMFDEDEEQVVEETVPVGRRGMAASGDYVGRGVMDENFDPMELEEAGGLELEDQILRDQETPSNAYNMMGVSFGPMAMLRHMYAMDERKMRSSMVRASMNLMDDAIDAAMWQDRLLFYLHSVTINWILLWIMIVRFALVAMGAINTQFFLDQMGLGIFDSMSFNVADLALAVIVTIPVMGAVVMEIYMHGVSDFLSDSMGNSFDLFVLVPLLLGCIALHVLNLAHVGEDIEHVSKLTVFAIWPVLSLFLLWRISRTIGSRVTLAQYFKATHSQTKSLDYIWVSKTHEDDSWLIEELLPLAGSNTVRLHRFITRHGPKTEPWMLDYEKIPLKTTYSRPDWDEVFGNLVERSRSGAVIGVFFCGPDSMARMVQSSAMKAMTKSMANALERGYQQGKDKGDSHREEEMGFSQSRPRGGLMGWLGSWFSGEGRDGGNGGSARQEIKDARDPRYFGCGVRISVRIENFT